MMERYEKSLSKIYETEKRKALKTLVNGKADKTEKMRILKEFAKKVINQADKIRSFLNEKSGVEQQIDIEKRTKTL